MSDGTAVLASPVRGEWICMRPPGHPRHAFDLVGVHDGRIARTSRARLLAGAAVAEDCHGWGRPVVCPADGVVASAHDEEVDHHRLVPVVDVLKAFLVRPLLYLRDRRPERMAGNHVLVEVPAGFVLLAHLRRGSVRVRAGERVRGGQELGRVGNSGNSVLPHLHLQLMSSPDPDRGAVVPFRLHDFEVEDDGRWRRCGTSALPESRTAVRFA